MPSFKWGLTREFLSYYNKNIVDSAGLSFFMKQEAWA